MKRGGLTAAPVTFYKANVLRSKCLAVFSYVCIISLMLTNAQVELIECDPQIGPSLVMVPMKTFPVINLKISFTYLLYTLWTMFAFLLMHLN